MKNIIVTGAHRSGSTWVGKMLSLDKRVYYVHEPFASDHDLGDLNIQIDKWYVYFDLDSLQKIKPKLDELFYNKTYSFLVGVKKIKKIKDIKKIILKKIKSRKFKSMQNSISLIKDPFVLFFLEELSLIFQFNILILVRHPAAFVGSLKKYNWKHDFNDFINQKMLMDKIDQEYKIDILNFPNNIVEQGILLWNIIYSLVLKYKIKYKNWVIYKYEDIAMNPIIHFKMLYQKFNLHFTDNVENIIKNYSLSNNIEENNNPMLLKRNSNSQIKNWKSRLTREEIEQIKEKTRKVWENFYSENDWE